MVCTLLVLVSRQAYPYTPDRVALVVLVPSQSIRFHVRPYTRSCKGCLWLRHHILLLSWQRAAGELGSVSFSGARWGSSEGEMQDA
ncbi:hypothetical protein CC86DRAFT_6755 [Ophiobolus disseminans]|uniref:Uncharacterized protein n=1 Tax=Ophiobolus disseminans TaxID=1469910 RepID=A0A6A7AJT7_9PLEO|nr:hypothetical protein CC86DRAFT_6755 [Ophiobolus disseminans]